MEINGQEINLSDLYDQKYMHKEIKKGNYDYRVNISSNDEMGVLSDAFNDMTESIKEKEFMRSTFGKIVDPNVRDYLLKGNVALGGETRNVTIMFCDIRNFTAMSESMSPEKVVSLLNKYFTIKRTIRLLATATANKALIPLESRNRLTNKPQI